MTKFLRRSLILQRVQFGRAALMSSSPANKVKIAVMEESEYLALDIGLLLPKSLTLSMFFWLQWLML